MKSHLKTKVYTLAAEMQHIHRNEIKWKAKAKAARARHRHHAIDYCESNFWSLRWHRVGLKSEARWSHLAYGFMRGRSYQQMEYISYGGIKGFNRAVPNWERIEEIVTKFSKDEPNHGDVMQRFGAWLAEARVWFDGNESRIRDRILMDAALRIKLAADENYQKERATKRAEVERIGRGNYAASFQFTK